MPAAEELFTIAPPPVFIISGLLNSIKAIVKIDRESTLGMDSQQRLEAAKLFFQNAEQTRNTIKEGNKSLLEIVDEQLALCKEELKQIDEALKSVDDEEKREALNSRKDEIGVSAEPPKEVD